MTPDQIKKELKELREICISRKKGAIAHDPKNLLEKYKTAIGALEPINQTIFTERIINGKIFFDIAAELYYSEKAIRMHWKKIISTLAELL